MKTHKYSRFPFIFISLTLVVLFNTASAWSTIVSDSLETTTDSINIVINGDTLTFKQHYDLEFPPYAPTQDSLEPGPGRESGMTASQPENELSATGSISRGIQVSSGASVSLQSSMYLKISGSLSEHYKVSGVLTDKTSPLQPIGNTRRLNDFDRVMVSVKGPALDVAIGDIDLRLSNGKFGQMERSIEGITLNANSRQASLNTTLGFSYGKYHLLEMQGKDGKQGPYRLIGENGEKFIIVLAGSEKVKLDDQILQRGEDDDYIIDYNAAEISFTQTRILSSNSRISIEFEYVPDIYLASYSFGKQLASVGFTLGEKDESALYISASFQELKDDQTNPLGNIETDFLKDVFVPLADTIATTWVSGIVSDTANGSYDLMDTDVLVYAGDGQGVYSVAFTFVGLAEGNYRKELGSSGNIFVYDTLKGEYLPAQKYFAPQSRSVFSISSGADFNFLEVNLDLGLSQSIKNLYASSRVTQNRIGWDLNLTSKGKYLALNIGDKYYESGYVSHDALESLEYYRLWRIRPRMEEEERLNAGMLRLGDLRHSYFTGMVSRLSRSGMLMGDQVQIIGKTDPERVLKGELSSSFTSRDSSTSQYHNLISTLETGRLTTELTIDIEESAKSSSYYAPNDHLKTGLGTTYSWSNDHMLQLLYARRMDYRLGSDETSFLASSQIQNWAERRQDWSSEYIFSDLLNSQGRISLKYREHENDSSASTRYFLGNFQLNGKALDDQLRFQEHYFIDEEHIPKYDYHYIEVDTGYGDFSFDPLIMDYIPMNGGRYARQRVFSDIEEQVRTYENKTRAEYSSDNFGKLDKKGFKSKLAYESRVKLQVDTKSTIQNQSLSGLDLFYQTGRKDFFRTLNYAGKKTSNRSTLYNYGREANEFNSHQIEAGLAWDGKNTSNIGLLLEDRSRDIEYNTLAQENWTAYRPFVEHILQITPGQRLNLLFKYSQIEDLHLQQSYQERFYGIDYNLRIRQRGRLDQKLTASRIDANVKGIPYSVFSGRQPGENWRYSVNGRYIFSSRFQLSINYSFQKRGDVEAEQFLRVEGRTHF